MDAQRGSIARTSRLLAVGGLVLGILLVVLVVLAVTTASTGLWVAALLVAALGSGAAALLLSTAPRERGETEPVDQAAAAPGEREIDDLPGFYESPPGSPAATSSAVPEKPAEPSRSPTVAPTSGNRAGTVAGLGAGSAALILVAAAVAVLGDDGAASGGADTAAPATTPDVTSSPTPTPPPAPLTADAAGDLATTELDPGRDGLVARLTFQGIVFEPRAAGATVTYPRLEVSSNGTVSVAHLELPTWNCFAPAAPPDPAAAGCTPTVTEYADLPSPDLQLQQRAGAFELSGSFPTYTRPNGSAPAYTGRTYAITIEADPVRGGRAPAEGTLQLGGASTPTTEDRTANVVQLSGD